MIQQVQPTSPEKSTTAPDGQPVLKKPRTTPEKHTTLTPNFKQAHITPRKLSSVKRVLFPEGTQPKSQIPDSLQQKVEDCKKALQQIEMGTLPLEERVALMPIKAKITAGAYICQAEANKPLLVVKPARQEPGAKYSPIQREPHPGISSGKSAVREFVAWLLQNRLGIDLGVPAVCLTTMRHPVFGDVREIEKNLEALHKLNITFTQGELFLAIHTHETSESFMHAFLEKHLPLGKEYDQVPQKLRELWHNRKQFTFAQIAADLTIPENNKLDKRTAFRITSIIEKRVNLQDHLKKLFALIKNKTVKKEAFVSAQQYKKNDGSLADLDKKERQHIPKEEFYKFVIDIILFNTDRTLENVLVKKELISTTEYIYRLIMIDHGLVLPDPLIRGNYESIASINCEITDLPLDSYTVEGPIKETILKLDVATFIEELKQDLQAHSTNFPEAKDAITDDCYSLLDFNLRLLQAGLKADASLGKIMGFQHPNYEKNADSEMISCFKKVMVADESGNYSLNHPLLQQILEERFKVSSLTQ